MAVLILVVIISVLCYLYYKQKNSHLFELAEKIPGPPTLPFVGNSLAISKYPGGILHYLKNSSKKYGSVTRHWVGTSLYVYINDPNDVEILLRDSQHIRKSATYAFLKRWLGQGLVTSTGTHWHTHRKALTPAFHFNILEKFVEIFNEKAKIMLKRLDEKAGKEIFNIMPFITAYTLDAILETSMGVKLNVQSGAEPKYVASLDRLQQLIQIRIFNPFLRSELIFPFTKNGKEQAKALDFINDYCKQLISEKKRKLADDEREEEDASIDDDIGKKNRMAFLDLLLRGQQNGNGFTDNDILEEVNTFLFAGHDTTATAISFATYCLAQNQDMQNKVYEEIVDLYGAQENDLTLQDLQKTHYLDMFVKEVLRMYPPVATFSRSLESDLQLSKHVIPAGTSLTCFVYTIHRNEKYYKNPDVFDPEHFSHENTKSRNPYAFVPFSAGPRNCIGQKYAMLEIKLTIIDLVRHFRILPGLDLEGVQSYIILSPTNGINIRLERRI